MNTVTDIIFCVYGAGISAGLIASAILFASLKNKYPKYYKELGDPTAFPNATADFGASGLKGQKFLMLLAIRGIPKGFPKDRKLRRIAVFMRYDLFVLLALFVVLLVITQKYPPS